MWKAVIATVFAVMATTLASTAEPEVLVLDTPRNLTVTNVSSFGASVSWEVSNSTKANLSDVIFWIVVEQDGTVVMSNESRHSEEPLSFELDSLDPSTEYTVVVHAESVGFQKSGTVKTTFKTSEEGPLDMFLSDSPRTLTAYFMSVQLNWTLGHGKVPSDYVQLELCQAACSSFRVLASKGPQVVQIDPSSSFVVRLTAGYKRSDVPQFPVTMIRWRTSLLFRVDTELTQQPLLRMRTYEDTEMWNFGMNTTMLPGTGPRVPLRMSAVFCFENRGSKNRLCPRLHRDLKRAKAPTPVRSVGFRRKHPNCLQFETDAPQQPPKTFRGYTVNVTDKNGHQIRNEVVTTYLSPFCDHFVAEVDIYENPVPVPELDFLEVFWKNFMIVLIVFSVCLLVFMATLVSVHVRNRDFRDGKQDQRRRRRRDQDDYEDQQNSDSSSSANSKHWRSRLRQCKLVEWLASIGGNTVRKSEATYNAKTGEVETRLLPPEEDPAAQRAEQAAVESCVAGPSGLSKKHDTPVPPKEQFVEAQIHGGKSSGRGTPEDEAARPGCSKEGGSSPKPTPRPSPKVHPQKPQPLKMDEIREESDDDDASESHPLVC